MIGLWRAALVIARRDYVATVWSRTFLLFLLGPLLPIGFGGLFGAIGGDIDRNATHPAVAVIARPPDAAAIQAAATRLSKQMGDGALPSLRFASPTATPAAQARALLGDERRRVVAVLSGGLDAPRLAGPEGAVGRVRGDLALILDTARLANVARGTVPAPVTIAVDPSMPSAGAQSTARLVTARIGQMVLVVLTMILAGMLLSNLIEEKSNKVIEVLAAAVPVDAIFLGKLIAMLGMSLTGIAVWGSAAAIGAWALLPAGTVPPPPAVGWAAFLLLGVIYFTASYLLLGALFLGIGAQASTVREVQTLSMPVTMGQLAVFALASTAVADRDGVLATIATLVPWSSPFAMIARAAQDVATWPHVAAMLWQALWIAIIIRFAAGRFRTSVLKSGPAPRRAFRWRRPDPISGGRS